MNVPTPHVITQVLHSADHVAVGRSEGHGAPGPHCRVGHEEESGQGEDEVDDSRRYEGVGVDFVTGLEPSSKRPEQRANSLSVLDEVRQYNEAKDGPEVARRSAVTADPAGPAPRRDNGQQRVVEDERRLVSEVGRDEEREPHQDPAGRVQRSGERDRDDGQHDQVRHPPLPEIGYGPENGRREYDEQRGDGRRRVDEPGPGEETSAPDLLFDPEREVKGEDGDREDGIREVVEDLGKSRQPRGLGAG